MRKSWHLSVSDVWWQRRPADTNGGSSTKGGCVYARMISIAVGAAVAAVGIASVAGAGSTANGTIVACQKAGKGTLRVVRQASDCRRGERVLTWNERGPAGPAGPPVPPGLPVRPDRTANAAQTACEGQPGRSGQPARQGQQERSVSKDPRDPRGRLGQSGRQAHRGQRARRRSQPSTEPRARGSTALWGPSTRS